MHVLTRLVGGAGCHQRGVQWQICAGHSTRSWVWRWGQPGTAPDAPHTPPADAPESVHEDKRQIITLLITVLHFMGNRMETCREIKKVDTFFIINAELQPCFWWGNHIVTWQSSIKSSPIIWCGNSPLPSSADCTPSVGYKYEGLPGDLLLKDPGRFAS